ncbi:DsbA family protein [Risungbinella massiliensis]|uniref:DsbA family protein n=1 Tax=Risungbinella massiliensis TaxID=1329796 RepID=UPI00069ADA8C|nr:DsbA family protein [Risungbinella massiliensis]
MANQHKKKRDMSGLVMITILILVVAIGAFGIIQQVMPKEVVDPFKDYYATQPTTGNINAKVKVVEFGDYKCPYCKTFTEQIYPQIKKDYIDTGKISFTFGNYAFIGPDSVTAAEAGLSIYKQNPDAFWKYHDLVYQNQGDERTQWATASFLLDLVRKNIPEVDANKVEQDLNNKTYQTEVSTSNVKAEQGGVQGTPAVFINGVQVDNPLDYSSVKAAIEEALKESAK